MKKLFFMGFAILLTLAFMGFSKSPEPKKKQSENKYPKQELNKKQVKDNSLRCIIYRTFIGDDSEGCGGGGKVCCANTSLNFS